ncbi:MAG TPA: hypothetical protein VGO96_05115 [Pyrinomonadaceae bacterium]|nr:hypothetical protein [Pyrinomonadaceae bacterium]
MKFLSRCLSVASVLACAAASVCAQATVASTSPSPSATAARTEANPPDLTVVKSGWSKERLGWERDPFSGPVENFDEMRVRARNEKRIDDAKRGGSPEVDRIRRESKADSAILEQRRRKSPPRYGFMYKVTVKNAGTRAIKSLDWDHVFFDTDTKVETGRHQFTSDEKIAPGKQKEFTVFASLPPAQTISVYDLNKQERASVGEMIVIMRILYADGTVWQRP